MTRTMSPQELEAAIREVGAERYHDKHPFHRLLHGGELGKGQVQAWALNRYCYQSGVPRKDAALISRAYDRELRREWVHRILDHDGGDGEEGGIERWLVLTDVLGLDRAYVISMEGALPATRFAVEAYVSFVRERTLLEAVASSLTELFALKSQTIGESGLYNALYQSDIRIDRVAIVNGRAEVALSGTLRLGGVCDEPRVVAQIESTVRQFSSVSSTAITMNGLPLADAVR